MVYRVYVEKKNEFAHEAESLRSELVDILQLKSVEQVRVVNRYDVEGCSKEIFDGAINTVFSELRLIQHQVSYAMVKTRAFLQLNFSQDNLIREQTLHLSAYRLQARVKGL